MTYLERGDFAVFAEHGGQVVFREVLVEVLDVDVGELFRFLAQLDLALFTGHETSHENLKKFDKTISTNLYS